ncbi:toxin-antitoxin system YwqK family antitoxin [uncultured Bacteroides sp.]|uniref:toxin-antitoxin system YwqK family antitoxin n=1 Tax=uncultured Bacteroides sp. TaxID=162156 RepID=UPI00262BDFC5|nr:toxin-antitoxin system YwqK family antitoxin [uncultured Bacteroides sp.]
MNGFRFYFVSLCFFLPLLLFAQKEYTVGQVTVINIGDGRYLFRTIKGESPLNGEHRIIDGYQSYYIQAGFKDGFYDGKYEEYQYNKLKCDGFYKEGRQEGVFKYYDSEGRVKEEKSYKNGKLDGLQRTFYTTGKVEQERSFKNGRHDGRDVYYDYDGTLRRDHNYVDGKQVGKQFSYLQGTYDLYETTYYNSEGLRDGKYTSIFTFGQPHILGQYKNGMKDGEWIEIAENGDTLVIEHYVNGKEDGLHVSFARGTGLRSKEYYVKNDRKNGSYKEYDLSTGEVKKEATYLNNRLHGKERRYITSNRYDYWEETTYNNGRRNGPFESRYVKNNRIFEQGQYRNDRKVGRWKRFDINGKLEREWEETKE